MGVNETYLEGGRRIVADDSRYTPEAYFFIQEAVTYTAEQLKRRGNSAESHPGARAERLQQHVTRAGL